MATIFEDFVTVALREAMKPYGGRSALQHRTHLDEAETVPIRPDFVWLERGAPRIVVDAKYKAEKPSGFPQADPYQLLAYCTVLGLPVGHLVYAKGFEDARKHVVRNAGVRLVAHTHDLKLEPAGLLVATEMWFSGQITHSPSHTQRVRLCQNRIQSAHTLAVCARIVSMKALDESLPSTFTTGTARAHGVHPRDLYAWRDEGQIIELSRGVFRRADAPPASYPDMIAVAYRAPRAIVCCVSAAAIYELTDEMPISVQIAVPKRSHAPEIAYPPVTVFRFSEASFELGLTSFEAGPDERVRVYDPARTVVDLIRLRARLGEPIAHAALHRYLAMPGARPALLLDYAEALGTFGPMRVALDIASAR